MRLVAIVDVASTASRTARPGAGAYSASKFALAGRSDAPCAEEHSSGAGALLITRTNPDAAGAT